MTIKDCSWWRLKIYEVDVSRLIMLTAEDLWSWRFLKRYNLWMCADRLSTFMRHATCHSLIGWCIRSKRHFVFCASFIYITYLSPFISTIFSQKSLSERSRQLCQNTPSRICIRRLLNRQLPFTKCGEYLFSLLFSSCILCLRFC